MRNCAIFQLVLTGEDEDNLLRTPELIPKGILDIALTLSSKSSLAEATATSAEKLLELKHLSLLRGQTNLPPIPINNIIERLPLAKAARMGARSKAIPSLLNVASETRNGALSSMVPSSPTDNTSSKDTILLANNRRIGSVLLGDASRTKVIFKQLVSSTTVFYELILP